MCKSKSEGGLRCSAHAKSAMVNAAAALEAAKTKAASASTPKQRDKANAALAKAQEHFDAKQAEFLTSPAGIELLESKAQDARLAGDVQKALRFQEQAETNKATREGQKAVAAVVQANYNWKHHHYRFDINGYNQYTGFSNFAGWNHKTDSEYDAAGYNHYGRDKDGRDRSGFDLEGYDLQGYDLEGWSRYGATHRDTGTRFATDGYDCDGYDAHGYDRAGWDREGFDRQGYDDCGEDRFGHDADGWKEGSSWNSLTNSVYDLDGYDRDGFDNSGYNRDGSHYSPLHDHDGYMAGQAVCLGDENGKEIWARREGDRAVPVFYAADPSEDGSAALCTGAEVALWLDAGVSSIEELQGPFAA